MYLYVMPLADSESGSLESWSVAAVYVPMIPAMLDKMLSKC